MLHHDLNRVLLTGRIYEEPDMRYTEDGEPQTTIVLASVRPNAQSTEQVDLFRLLVCGEPLAETCNELPPHTHVLVEGRIQSSTAEAAEERARFPFEVLIHQLILLSSPPNMPGATAASSSPRSPAPAAAVRNAPARAPSAKPTAFPGIPRPVRSIQVEGRTSREADMAKSPSYSFELADLPL